MPTPVEEIKARLDTVEIIGRDLRLQRSGRNWKGLCPFHAEKTPSFHIFPDRGNFKCFGCGEGGDVFTYVMRRDGVGFPEALQQLAREAGVDIGRNQPNPEARERQQTILDLLQHAEKFLHEQLLNSPAAAAARDYVHDRGITDAMVEQFKLGYASSRGSPLLTHLRHHGFENAAIELAGLTTSNERSTRDYLFDRLVFPIWTPSGAVVGFGGRTLRNIEPKYLNTRDSEVFTKGHHLYGFHLARERVRKTGTALIVEGYMDAIAAHQAGFANTVASMGTSLTIQQARGLIASGAKRVVIALDADTAGITASRRGLNVLREAGNYTTGATIDVRGLVRHEDLLNTDIAIAELPPGEDPDSLIRNSPSEWAEAVNSPTPLADFAFQWASKDHNLDSLVGRRAAMRELLPIVAEIKDAVVRSHYFDRLSDLCGVPSDELRRLSARDGRNGAPGSSQTKTASPSEGSAEKPDQLEEGLLKYVVRGDAQTASLIGGLDPANLQDLMDRHILTVIISDIRSRGNIDWSRIESDLDTSAQQRLQEIRAQASLLPSITAQQLGTGLQYTTLQLRLRRLNDEVEETILAAAEDPSLRQRVQEIHEQILTIHRAREELDSTRYMPSN
jgi:DNA primase